MSNATYPVVLLQPPGACRNFTRSGSLYPPLGLCFLAATVPEDLCIVLDADALGFDIEATYQAILAYKPKLIGMTLTSYTTKLVEEYAALFHQAGIKVMVGGPHASLAPEDTLRQCPSVTYAIRGEAEAIFPQIVERTIRDEPLDGLPGVCTRREQAPLISQQIIKVEDLGRIPRPRLEGLPIGQYWCPDAKRRPLVTMVTTRGCPHQCGFCSSPELLGRKVRYTPLEKVFDELEFLTKMGIKEISFVDDVFTINRKRAIELCKGLLERKIDISWFCNARADQLDKELADWMSKAGCHQVYLGFESGSQRILDSIKKGATVEQLEKGAECLRSAGIKRSVGFVIGLPGESDETVLASIGLAQRVRPERLQFTRFTPLVGSPLYRAVGNPAGFHDRNKDQVGLWIDRCYEACRSAAWGQESW